MNMAQTTEDKKKDKEQDLQLINQVLEEITQVRDSSNIGQEIPRRNQRIINFSLHSISSCLAICS